ncbi:MAG: LpxL/LpxP family Kdo(2)-lipid IV(A) lauroyl/palmitoleoyl acyltransferase [Arenimonas sp.]
MPSPDMGSAPRQPRHWPTWLLIAFAWTLARWPWALQRRAGVALGALMRVAMIRRRRTADANLAWCYPEMSDASRAKLLRAHFTSLGIGVFEFLRAWWGRLEPLDRTVTISGLEHLRAAQAGGRGVILVSPHFTTLEICVRLLSRQVALAGMYRPHEQPALEWAVRRARAGYTLAMFPRDALRPAVRHVRDGGVLWFAPDQQTRRGESVFVPFFGRPAWTLTSTHQMARLTGAAVLPLFHRRRDDGSYEIEIGEPLADFPSADAVADTARVMATLEAMIRREPAQYLWIHARFKKQPPGEDGPYL